MHGLQYIKLNANLGAVVVLDIKIRKHANIYFIFCIYVTHASRGGLGRWATGCLYCLYVVFHTVVTNMINKTVSFEVM